MVKTWAPALSPNTWNMLHGQGCQFGAGGTAGQGKQAASGAMSGGIPPSTNHLRFHRGPIKSEAIPPLHKKYENQYHFNMITKHPKALVSSGDCFFSIFASRIWKRCVIYMYIYILNLQKNRKLSLRLFAIPMYKYMVMNYIQLFSPNRVWVKSFVFVVHDLGPAGLQTFLDKCPWAKMAETQWVRIYIYIYIIWDCYWIAIWIAIRLLFGLRLGC